MEGFLCAEVPIFADEFIDPVVFTKTVYTWCNDEEFGIVGKSHPGAVYSLVADPSTVKFVRIEVDNGLLYRLFEDFEIDLHTQLSGAVEAFDVVADEEPADRQLAV